MIHYKTFSQSFLTKMLFFSSVKILIDTMSKKALIVASVLAILLSAAMFSLFYSHLLSHQPTAPSKLPEQQEIEQGADASPQPTEDSTPATPPDSQIVVPESSSPSLPSLPRLPPTSLPYLSPDNSNLISEQPMQSPELGSHFEFDVLYAYVHSYVSGGVHGLSDYLVFNITFVSDAETDSSDIAETFLVEICSGEQVIGRGTFGFASNGMFVGGSPDLLLGLMAEYSAVHMTSSGSWVANKSCLRTNSVTIFKITDSGNISVRVQRIEWLSTTSTETNSHSLTLVEQVQLEKFGNGFLYNTIVPEDQLSQIDLFNPPYPPGSATNLGYAFTAELRR